MAAEKQREWVEVLAPFSGRGFKPPITGVLISLSKFRQDGKEKHYYTFRRKDGTLFSFSSVHDLDRIIQPHHVNHWMCVKLNADYSWPQMLVWTTREREWLVAPRQRLSDREIANLLSPPMPAPFRPIPFKTSGEPGNAEIIEKRKQREAELLKKYGTCGICGARRDMCCC